MLKAKLGQTVFISLLCLALFWDLKEDSITGVFNKIGAFFFLCVNQVMLNMMAVIQTFASERPIFLREQANSMYGVVPYYMTKVGADMPGMIIGPILLSSIVYWGMGMQ